MTDAMREQVLEKLGEVPGPNGDGNLVSLGLIENVLVDQGKVIFSIKVPAERAQALENLRLSAQEAVSGIEGVDKVTAVLTAERSPGKNSATPQPKRPDPAAGRTTQAKAEVPGIKSIIAVASGKGGVGKSTTSVNLALSLQALGQKVGILDADIYGPSMPRMLGVSGKPESEGRTLKAVDAYGLKVMSIGFLVEEESPMIWRGPMVISALTQMLREVEWGELDILVVDMPPGTGDAQLTMAQQVPLAGAVIVSTPQDIALIDARKGLNMFKKVNVPILGLIENMSTFVCPKCGERSDIFGHGGARDDAERMNVPFLGEVPLHLDIRTNSDAGTPVTATMPESVHSEIYREIAHKVLGGLEQINTDAPKIVFE